MDRWRGCAWVGLCALGLVLGANASPAVAQAQDANKYTEALKDAKSVPGVIKLHQVKSQLYAELTPAQLDQDFLVLISIARGIGEGGLLGGMTWGFGDDWLWRFIKVDDRIQIVRRNTRFRAAAGSPEARAVHLAYTDSVLFSMPITATGPGGSHLVNVTQVFMSDLPQITDALPPGFIFAPDKSNWGPIKGFKDNVELEVAATYASKGSFSFETVPDSRGVTLNIHYSISRLPKSNFQSRQADPRVGYFVTVLKDFSTKSDEGEERFVRYINRWNLEKADPKAELSAPKKPIVFWLEKTIPYKYRPAIQAGILEWNKAFEQAGFVNAIEVRQQPEDADWDPEDVSYNTFRWITAGAGFAMGPSRVNPYTGEILDADIIFDSDFIQFWKHEYEYLTPKSIAALTGGPLDLESYEQELAGIPPHLRHSHLCRCNLAEGFGHQLAFGSSVLQLREEMAPGKASLEKLIMQGLKEVSMHEVGHTLGLRHNFKASTLYSLKDMQDANKTRDSGLVASVMDYSPVNLATKGQPQGDYYTTTVGPYDRWAIEYGYKPLTGGTDGEVVELKKIASKGAQKGLDYATDEDTRGIDPDPLTNRFDLGGDPLEYAAQQAKLVNELWPDLVKRVVADGEGYQKARRAFGILLSTYGQSMYFASRNVGGLYVHRDHKGDPNSRAPFVVVDAAKQRATLQLLQDQVFNDRPFNFPPDLYNHLASTRWNHWGSEPGKRTDYPIHEYILMWQERILSQVMSSLTLTRLHDSELAVPADQDAMTTAEVLDRLTNSIFAELKDLKVADYTNRKPAISSLRRNLQRAYLRRLTTLATGSGAPEDCQTVAYFELVELKGKLRELLARQELKLDTYTQAHVMESAELIDRVLNARLSLLRP